MKMIKLALLLGCAALTVSACATDASGKSHFDAVKACKRAVLVAPSIDLARKVALDAGAKPADVDHATAVAADLAAFASIICGGIGA